MATDQEKISSFARRRIRDARVYDGWSQEQLGEAIGKSNANISDIERGRLGISFGDMVLIAKALNRPLTYFVPAKYISSVEDFKLQTGDVEAAKLHNRLAYPQLQESVRDFLAELVEFSEKNEIQLIRDEVEELSVYGLKRVQALVDDRLKRLTETNRDRE